MSTVKDLFTEEAASMKDIRRTAARGDHDPCNGPPSSSNAPPPLVLIDTITSAVIVPGGPLNIADGETRGLLGKVEQPSTAHWIKSFSRSQLV